MREKRREDERSTRGQKKRKWEEKWKLKGGKIGEGGGKWKEKGGSNEVMKEKLGGKRLRETKSLLPIKLWISARSVDWRNYLNLAACGEAGAVMKKVNQAFWQGLKGFRHTKKYN